MSKTIQFHILNTISQALTEVFTKDKNADRMIDKYMRTNQKWTPTERKFFAESIYDIVRHRRNLEFLAESEDLWKIITSYLHLHDLKPPVRKEFLGLDPAEVKKRNQLPRSPGIQYSLPDWLSDLIQQELPLEWEALFKSLNTAPEVYLRTNTLKISREKLIAELKAEQINVSEVRNQAEALWLKERKNIFSSQSFKKGLFEMQDAGSQSIAPLLDLKPNQNVVDACAGSGGKSLHIAALMQNKGKILAMDIQDWKLKDLNDRAQRAGISILQTKLISSPKIIQSLEAQFDRVLLDAPCSGLGVLKRNPDTKWKITPEEIERLITLQRDILSRYSSMCKAGGVMVYATCSILKRENEDQTKWFLASPSGKNWQLQKEIRIWPHKDNCDGFYAAVFKKK